MKTKEGVVGYISPKMCEFTPGEISEDGTVTTDAASTQAAASADDSKAADSTDSASGDTTGSQTGQTLDFGLEIDENLRR